MVLPSAGRTSCHSRALGIRFLIRSASRQTILVDCAPWVLPGSPIDEHRAVALDDVAFACGFSKAKPY
jgi:hypothetical protein